MLSHLSSPLCRNGCNSYRCCPGPGGLEEAAKGQLPLHLIVTNLHVAQHGLKPGAGLATQMDDFFLPIQIFLSPSSIQNWPWLAVLSDGFSWI